MLRVLRAFLLLTYLLFLTIQKAVVAGGKYPKATTWSPEGAPNTSSDIQVTSATTGAITLDTGGTSRSANFALTGENYKGELKWEAALNISPAAVAEGENKGVAVKFSTAMVVNVSAGAPSLKLAGSFTTEALTITSAGHTLPAIEVSTAATATYRLTDALSMGTAALSLVKGVFDANGQTVTTGSIVASGGSSKSLTLGASSVTLSGTGTAFDAYSSGAAVTVSAASSSITMTGSEAIFIGGNANTYGTLIANCATKATIRGPSPESEAESFASITVGTLALNAAENVVGTKVAIKVTTALTTTATSGSKKKLVTGKSGQKAKLNLSGKTVSLEGIELKDFIVEQGTLNIANGADLGGNSAGTEGAINFTSGVELTTNAAAASSAASLATTAQTQIAPSAAVASSEATLSTTAPTKVPLGAAASSAEATVALTAPTSVALSAASAASSAATLLVSGAIQLTLSAASSESAADVLPVNTVAKIVTNPASGESGAGSELLPELELLPEESLYPGLGDLQVSVPQNVALNPAKGESGGSLFLNASISLLPATGTSNASLTITAPTKLTLGVATSESSASLTVTAPVQTPIVLAAASASSSAGVLPVSVTIALLLNLATAESGADTLPLKFPITIGLNPAVAESAASLSELRFPIPVLLNAASATSSATATVTMGFPIHPSTASASSSARFSFFSFTLPTSGGETVPESVAGLLTRKGR